MLTKEFLEGSIKQMHYYKALAEKSIEQLSEEQLFWQYNEESNSIAIIIQHLVGNMLSRWTDFLTTDGEKEWRNRDEEFDIKKSTKAELLTYWNKGWDCMFHALQTIPENKWDAVIYIRAEAHTITDAIVRQLAHYPYHVGQIVFIAKMCCNTSWKSLSIPRGNSQQYNKEKFGT